MLNFDMHLPTRIIFGRDTQKEIGSLIKPYTKKRFYIMEETASRKVDYIIRWLIP